jgi:fermentation-respiration switch protein FrsA (DUF1100 family)
VALLTVVLVGAGVWVVVSQDGDAARGRGAPVPSVSGDPAGAGSASPAPTRPAVAPRGPFPIARVDADFVDPTRPTPARGAIAGRAGRPLPTVIRYPDVAGVGPFPLVVFAHGYANRTENYSALLDGIAAAGYVVAAPEFPLTSTAIATPVGARDAAEQVVDVAFVVDAVRALASADGPLRGRVGPDPVALIGHSDGGITVAAAGYASAVRDPRVGAVVVLSGARGDFGGAWFPDGSPPLLAVHPTNDTVNGFASSRSLYDGATTSRARFLVSIDGGHVDAFTTPRSVTALVALVDEFLRAALRTDPGAAGRVTPAASVPGVLDLVESSGSLG